MTRRGSCPLPELALASRMDTLPADVQQRVVAHVEHCATCQALLEALDDADVIAPTPEERLRIRARVSAGIAEEPPTAAGRPRRWKWLTVAAAVLVGGTAAVLVWQRATPRPVQPEASLSTLEKPTLRIPLAARLVWRGDDREAAELTRALEPYVADNFPEAARRLAAFVGRYPQNAVAHFYLGVSQMFLGADADAMTALARAEQLAREDPELSGESTWHLALAYQRANLHDRAIPKLEALCRGQHARSAQACAALREPSSEPSDPRRR